MAKSLTNLRALTRLYAVNDSTSTAYSDTDTLLNLNARYQEAFLLATANDGDFEFNADGSQSISITAAERQYSLATNLFKVSRVEVKYPSSATDYREATQINNNSIRDVGKANYTPGWPEFDLLGTKIEIFVSAKTADIAAVTNGIKVYYQKELTELSSGTDEVIFPDVFARYICAGAAIDYCGVNGLTTRLSWLTSEHDRLEVKLTEFVASRNKAKRFSLSFRQEDYGSGSGYGTYVSDKMAF